MARLIQIFEHENLTISENHRGEKLEISELEKLYAFNDQNNNIYFTGIRNGVKFNSYVGVIKIGGLTIEILPKADKNQSHSKTVYMHWRNALLNMLSICRKIKVESVSEANLNKRYYSLLDLYFELFINELSYLLRSGLLRKYHKQSSNTTALKGRIDFGKNIQKNLVHKERFYTFHQVYDYEHLINQILLKALNILSRIVSNATLKDRIARLKRDFPEIKEIPIYKSHFDQIKESRKTVPYWEAIKIAKMIILNYAPDIKGGQDNMLALLFDMNSLWEEYVYRMLQRNKPDNIQVNFQNSQKFWEGKTIRPDIVLTKTVDQDVQETYIIDTKWKIIEYQNPSDADLKQMYAYNIYWNCRRSMLLYPNVKEYPESFGKFHKGKEGENKCKLGFVNVLDASGGLDKNIGRVILEKLIEN
ncbi:MAG: restriction endonuclease [Flavobacteriales bacterium]|nr:restriction endonuclease [Flavobacteriales bacterium]